MLSLIKVINPTCKRICAQVNLTFLIATNKYSVPSISLGKAKKAKGPVLEKISLPVETDPHKLVNYVCGSNIMKEGDDIKLQPDSEYPDWLWTLHIGKPKTLEEMDPNTIQYWKKVRQQGMIKKNKIKSLSKL